MINRLNPEAARHFRDELRHARAMALQDAEGFSSVLFAVERLGAFLAGKIEALGTYREPLRTLAEHSPMAHDVPEQHPDLHSKFDALYGLVLQGRNEAMHQGAAARHLTTHVVELATILEDALMATDAPAVRDFMVRSPTCASMWEPLSSIRRSMLLNAFSYLPVAVQAGSAHEWKLVSDVAVATYLRGAEGRGDQKRRLATSLEAAVGSGGVVLLPAPVCQAGDDVRAALAMSDHGQPVLVVQTDRATELVGLLTPFDLL